MSFKINKNNKVKLLLVKNYKKISNKINNNNLTAINELFKQLTLGIYY